MEEAGLVIDELNKTFQDRGDATKYHPYHRDWIEIILNRDYLLTLDFHKISAVCKKYNLEFHAKSKGWLFKKTVLCIYDKNHVIR